MTLELSRPMGSCAYDPSAWLPSRGRCDECRKASSDRVPFRATATRRHACPRFKGAYPASLLLHHIATASRHQALIFVLADTQPSPDVRMPWHRLQLRGRECPFQGSGKFCRRRTRRRDRTKASWVTARPSRTHPAQFGPGRFFQCCVGQSGRRAPGAHLLQRRAATDRWPGRDRLHDRLRHQRCRRRGRRLEHGERHACLLENAGRGHARVASAGRR